MESAPLGQPNSMKVQTPEALADAWSNRGLILSLPELNIWRVREYKKEQLNRPEAEFKNILYNFVGFWA
jgi:hypothetical protein